MESNNTFQVKKISEPISLKIKRNWIYLKMETKKILKKALIAITIVIIALGYFRGYEIILGIKEAVLFPAELKTYSQIREEFKKPMLESGIRLQERVDNDRDKEVDKQYKDVSEADEKNENIIAGKTAKAATSIAIAGNDWKAVLKSTPMEEAIPYIEKASAEWNVPAELIVGIASAESSLHKNYAVDYDHNCFNPWGIRKDRTDGSQVMCFYGWEYSSNTIGKLLREYYLNEGRITPEQIVQKYVGGNAKSNWPSWVKNVSVFYKG